MDDEGFLYLTGRKKNLIILSNGENVSPEAIEYKFDGDVLISDILVFGAGDVDYSLEEVFLNIINRNNANSRTII